LTTDKINADDCFVCGKKNEAGLKINFRMENEVCLGEYYGLQSHVGFGNIIHGGIIYSLLDDAMANWFYLQGAVGYTAKASIRYRSKMLVGDSGLITAQLVSKRSKLLSMKSSLSLLESNTVIAECEGRFILSSSDPMALMSEKLS
tara:strand:- start:315 stop:752 length:438 start_codon:yes stop_codon:yes gene_type:complete